MSDYPQGRTHGSDGGALFRWFVYIDDGKRVTSWAATAEEARTKTIERRGCTVHRAATRSGESRRSSGLAHSPMKSRRTGWPRAIASTPHIEGPEHEP